jgi:DNA-binding response OmpR family regulator
MSRHVLIVDDDSSIAGLVKYIVLQMPGTTAQTAGSGQRALQCIGEKRPDLVVLDIMLPDIDGAEVCRRLRANSATARLPVLMISGHLHLDQIARDAGATDYLPKPFNLTMLEHRIKDILFDSEMPAPRAQAPMGSRLEELC